jgi:hypothetical protein
MKNVRSIGSRIPRRLVTLGFAAMLLAPAAARAAECPESSPEDPQERRRLAKEWFSNAEAAENAGNDTEATRDYACSYKMVAHPFTAYNLARVAERSGDLELSLKMFKAYLALKPDAKDKEEVKAKVKVIEDKMAADKSGASPETAAAPPTEPTPPTAEEQPAAPEPTPDVLAPPPEPKPADVVHNPPEPEPEPEKPSNALYWAIGGAAGAALVGGIITNVVARAKMDTCRADAGNNDLAKANDECNAARPMAYTSYALFGLAGAGAALDAVLILLHRRSGGSSDDDEAFLHLVPLPGGGGLLARGKF